jgi:aminoglycoside 6'-N-acetyltransferase
VKATADPLPRYGAGVVLRRLSASDLTAFQAYRNDIELGRYQGWSVMPDAEARAFLEEMNTVPLFRPGEWAQVAIAEPKAMVLLGDIGLYLAEDSSHAEIGFTLARPVHGRGLATAAAREAVQLIFDLTTVSRVLGITDARNHASVGVLARIGMRKQEERTAIFRGESCVECVYAVERVTANNLLDRTREK